MRRSAWLLALIPISLFLVWAWGRRSAPAEVPLARVTRETIVSTLNTNGKVEPIEWMAVRAELAGPIDKLQVDRGHAVRQGQPIAQIDTSDARARLAAAEARIAQVRAEIEVLERGGRAPELAEIESSLQRGRASLAVLRREHEALRRLHEKNAVTRAEVDAAKARVESAELELLALERKRGSLVSPPDKSAAEARLRGAQAEAQSVLEQLSRGDVRSPMNGIVYQLDVRTGAYVNPGDQIASVGRLNQLRVTVYVDEPELGRVSQGMPVTITWDARPGREWKGTVEKIPTQVVPLGTRQVGEVVCIIENPDTTLLPGTNVNAEIRSKVVSNALTIPKEALRREGQELGVLKLAGDKVMWQPVQLGAASVTRAEVAQGLSEGDRVALPVDRPLKNGDPVVPVDR